ncbi:MAG: DNA polymerase III subunit beta [Candidatus Doudnabacteria bacterium RIFCSPHIGHO2_01_FULL_50_11]|uniref:Beta sliding clamp n=1 Tax=Candidatus Doudnabacteria bacterium RIFCSPHIGHO2_01_FULL_50_11 TaxID=1817828 RepID=A0A1F5PGB3_9BACT|nr:MAG: DNA polymerase III subunit beta [Candidatus Doudnabacteria bacterium RIFCSPHIGHO2_01_FULL_50_11]HLC44933.1 DNA polymerase III subunit beta [Patescibacteria group bacterium]
MKVICTKDNLKKALTQASRIVGTTSALPILNNVLLKTEAGQLLISSTNLEIALKTRIGGQIEEAGEITVPARTFSEYIGNINEEKITLQTKNINLLVKTEKTESILKGLPTEDFPLIPEIKPVATVSINTLDLSQALERVAFASAYSETQPELSGVLFQINATELRLAATDRYRLAESITTLTGRGIEAKLIIPNRAVGELLRILGETEQGVEILIADSQALFRTANSEFISRVIEGQYPDYQQIIPREFTTEIRVKTRELVSALKLSGLFVQDNNNVEMKIRKSDQSLILRATSSKYGSNTSLVQGEVIGNDNEIIFNFRYILDCLNHITQDHVLLKVINNSSPAMIVPQDEASRCLYLVMPIKT